MSLDSSKISKILLNYSSEINKDFKLKMFGIISRLETFKFISNYVDLIPPENFPELMSKIEENNQRIPNKILEPDINYLYYSFLNNTNIEDTLKDICLSYLLKTNLTLEQKSRIFKSNFSLDLKIKYMKLYFPENSYENNMMFLYSNKEILTKEIIKKILPKSLTKKEIMNLAFDYDIDNIDEYYLTLEVIDSRIEENKNTISNDSFGVKTIKFSDKIEMFMFKLPKKELDIFISKPIEEQKNYFNLDGENKNEELIKYYKNYLSKFKFSDEIINGLDLPLKLTLKKYSFDELEKIIKKEINEHENKTGKIQINDLNLTKIILNTQNQKNEIFLKFHDKIKFSSYIGDYLDKEIFTKEKIIEIIKKSKPENIQDYMYIFFNKNLNLDEKTIKKIFIMYEGFFDNNIVYFLLNNKLIKNNDFIIKLLNNVKFHPNLITTLLETQILSLKIIKLLEKKSANNINNISNIIYNQPLITNNIKNKLSDNYSEDLGMLYNYNYVCDNLDIKSYEKKVMDYVSNFKISISGGLKLDVIINYVICLILKENNLKIIKDKNQGHKIITDDEYQNILKSIEKENKLEKPIYSDYGLSI